MFGTFSNWKELFLVEAFRHDSNILERQNENAQQKEEPIVMTENMVEFDYETEKA